MKRSHDWQKFEDFLAEEFKEIAPYATHTKGSQYGDLKNIPHVHVEAKSYNNINAYQHEWLQKCISEVPLHSDKVPMVITKNKSNDIVVHISWLDFKEIFFEYYKLKFGQDNE